MNEEGDAYILFIMINKMRETSIAPEGVNMIWILGLLTKKG